MSTTSLELVSFTKGVATFEANHCSPKTGTTLNFTVKASKDKYSDLWTASVDLGNTGGDTAEEAIGRLASWLERAAETLRMSGPEWSGDKLPLGGKRHVP